MTAQKSPHGAGSKNKQQHQHYIPTGQLGARLLARLRGKPKPVERFNRDHLPSPRAFWAGHGVNLPQRSGWVSVKCVFHDDRNPSLSIHPETGGFICHSCGAKGGDVLAAHRLLTGDDFVTSAKALDAWGRS